MGKRNKNKISGNRFNGFSEFSDSLFIRGYIKEITNTLTLSTVIQNNMPHSLTKIWIHLIFGTKERTPLINQSFEKQLYDHIRTLLEKDFGCNVDIINGTADHIHISFLQNQNYSLAEIVKTVKGNSSHWINQNKFLKAKFAWQTGYGAFSVSESMINEVRKYIANQKEHHRKISFAEENKKFAEKYGLSVGNR